MSIRKEQHTETPLPVCPYCGEARNETHVDGRVWQVVCKVCGQRFWEYSATNGTFTTDKED